MKSNKPSQVIAERSTVPDARQLAARLPKLRTVGDVAGFLDEVGALIRNGRDVDDIVQVRRGAELKMRAERLGGALIGKSPRPDLGKVILARWRTLAGMSDKAFETAVTEALRRQTTTVHSGGAFWAIRMHVTPWATEADGTRSRKIFAVDSDDAPAAAASDRSPAESEGRRPRRPVGQSNLPA